MPRWTTRRASRALSGELGRPRPGVMRVAVLPDGRVVTGGGDGRVLVWDPADPGADPAELGRPRPGVGGGGAGRRAGSHRRRRRAGAAVGPGRSRSQPGRAGPPPHGSGAGGGGAGRRAGSHRRSRPAGAAVGPGRVPAPARPSWADHGPVRAVAVLADGRVVTGGGTGGCWCGTRPIPGPARPS